MLHESLVFNPTMELAKVNYTKRDVDDQSLIKMVNNGSIFNISPRSFFYENKAGHYGLASYKPHP